MCCLRFDDLVAPGIECEYVLNRFEIRKT